MKQGCGRRELPPASRRSTTIQPRFDALPSAHPTLLELFASRSPHWGRSSAQCPTGDPHLRDASGREALGRTFEGGRTLRQGGLPPSSRQRDATIQHRFDALPSAHPTLLELFASRSPHWGRSSAQCPTGDPHLRDASGREALISQLPPAGLPKGRGDMVLSRAGKQSPSADGNRRNFAPAGATKGLSDRPLETFGSHYAITGKTFGGACPLRGLHCMQQEGFRSCGSEEGTFRSPRDPSGPTGQSGIRLGLVGKGPLCPPSKFPKVVKLPPPGRNPPVPVECSQ